ncbi:MAG: hypothetical protein ACREVL_01685 [Solimonas sp.]
MTRFASRGARRLRRGDMSSILCAMIQDPSLAAPPGSRSRRPPSPLPDLLTLRPALEAELRTIGARVSSCSSTELVFEGGDLERRPMIHLSGGTIRAKYPGVLSTSARVSPASFSVLGVALAIFGSLSLLSRFFVPMAAGIALWLGVSIVIAVAGAQVWLGDMAAGVLDRRCKADTAMARTT